MPKKYRSDALAAIHETMEGLHDAGVVNKQTMREFDEACLTPVRTLSPEEIKSLRMREHISQPVFARYLNVSKNLVSALGTRRQETGRPGFASVGLDSEKGTYGDCLKTLWCGVRFDKNVGSSRNRVGDFRSF
jgi:putative transcriptional regulator